MAEVAVQGEIDTDPSALIGTAGSGPIPDFNDIFGENNETQPAASASANVDLGSSGFPPVKKHYEEKGHTYFDDPNYYKTALSNEGEIAQRVHGILQKYLTTKDPKDRSVFRQQFIAPYWEYLLNVARKSTGKLLPPKKFLLRFGILHPTFLNAETRALFSKIVVENELDQPVYYLDEWLKGGRNKRDSPFHHGRGKNILKKHSDKIDAVT